MQLVRLLQSIAAVGAISTASYTLFLEDYLRSRPVKVLECAELIAHDADSLVCDGVEVRMIGSGEPGITGIDSPETIRAQCPRERDLGIAALREVRRLLPDVLQVEDTGVRDPYLRPLVRVRMRDGDLLEDRLLAAGMAVVWSAAYKRRWCTEPAQGFDQ